MARVIHHRYAAPSRGVDSRQARRMTRRTPLPAAAVGRGMTTREARMLGVSRSRLRASDLSSPRRGTWMEAARLATLADHLGALSKVLPAHAFFCGTTAAE